jgi:stage II sporulation protein M
MDEKVPLEPPVAPTLAPAPVPRRPGLVARLYREEREAWRRDYRRYFKIAARALGLGFIAGYLFFSLWPAQEQRVLHFVVQALKDIDLKSAPLVLALTLFWHNTRVTVLWLLAGIIPYLFLPALDTLVNGGVLGLLVSIAKHQHLPVPRLIVTQILPHGVFELAGILYATSVGLYLSGTMARKVRAARRKKRAAAGSVSVAPGADRFLETYAERKEAAALASPARNVVRSFFLVVLPLLFVAAMIEGLVTPLLR